MLHFAGKSDDHGHAEGDWHIPDGLKGQFSLDLQQEPPTENMIAASQEIERQGLMTSTGRKLWIELKIVTPEQALVKIPARLDMTIEDLKAAIMKSKRFFCLDELASTKNFAPALKNCGSKLSTINAMHSQLRFELSREKKKPHHRTLDGLALENAKPLSYYNIQNGTTLHMHLQMPITIISPTMVNPIPTNLVPTKIFPLTPLALPHPPLGQDLILHPRPLHPPSLPHGHRIAGQNPDFPISGLPNQISPQKS